MTRTKEKDSKISNQMFAVSKRVGMAIADYDMLAEGDKIIVAVSGGKDSLSLVKLLNYRKSFIPINIELMAVHIDMGLPDFPIGRLVKAFGDLGVKYHVEKVDVLGDGTWDELNCFWCSNQRRKALFQLADKFGYNKIALGHHMDDIIETILLNLFYHGEIAAMKPKQELFKGKVTIIRPLAYVEEKELKRLVKKEGLPDIDQYNCPRNDTSKRMFMKDLIKGLEKENSAVKMNIFRSLERIKEDYLLDKG